MGIRLLVAVLWCTTGVPFTVAQDLAESPHEFSNEGKKIAVIVSEYVAIDKAESREWKSAPQASALETQLENCVEAAVREARLPLSVMPAATFRRGVFPNLAEEEAPQSLRSYEELLQSEDFVRRVASVGVRYLVLVRAKQHRTESGGIGCVGGYGGGACLGLVTWDKRIQLDAELLDLSRQRKCPQQLGAEATGQSWFAMALVFPLGMPSDPTASACEKLAARAAAALRAPTTSNLGACH